MGDDAASSGPWRQLVVVDAARVVHRGRGRGRCRRPDHVDDDIDSVGRGAGWPVLVGHAGSRRGDPSRWPGACQGIGDDMTEIIVTQPTNRIVAGPGSGAPGPAGPPGPGVPAGGSDGDVVVKD